MKKKLLKVINILFRIVKEVYKKILVKYKQEKVKKGL